MDLTPSACVCFVSGKALVANPPWRAAGMFVSGKALAAGMFVSGKALAAGMFVSGKALAAGIFASALTLRFVVNAAR